MLNIWDSKLHDSDCYLIRRTGGKKKKKPCGWWPHPTMGCHISCPSHCQRSCVILMECSALLWHAVKSPPPFLSTSLHLTSQTPATHTTASAVHLELLFPPVFPVLVLTQARTLNMWNIIIHKGSSPMLSKFKTDPGPSFKQLFSTLIIIKII